MTKDDFLSALRRLLAGFPADEIEEIVGDYAAHFAESATDGRDEAEVAAALGDPARIVRELRAEVGLRRLEAHWSFSNMLAALVALTRLVFVDILILLPLLLAAAVFALALAIVLAAIGAVGLRVIVTTAFALGEPVLETIARLFLGAGLISSAVAGLALLLMGSSASIRVLGRYARRRTLTGTARI